jgi:small subunit ribosomal protein S2
MNKKATTKSIEKLSLMSLFEVGAHRGNKKSKLNPKLRKSVFGTDKGMTLIDLVKTKDSLEKVSSLFYSLGSKKKQILIVGTSKHLTVKTQEISEQFKPEQMPYVNHRWLGGTLTNWPTIKKTLNTLEKLRNIEGDANFLSKLSKNERLSIKRKKEKIERFFAGLTKLKSNKPAAVFVLDTPENDIAIKEAEIMNIPVIALTNTSTTFLPSSLDNTIVCNINSINTIELVLNLLVESYNEGYKDSIEIKEDSK